MARNGKIARLPRHIRDQLPRRLDDGESGVHIVSWLNGLPDLQRVLEQDFEGRPINEQNLTEWKQGGFLVWARLQASCESWRLATEDAGRFAEETGPAPLSDHLSPMVALVLGKAISDFSGDSLADPESRKQSLALLAELARLRRADHDAARLRIHLEQYERQRAQNRLDEARAAESAALAKAKAAELAASEKINQERNAIIEEANERYRLRYSRSKAAKLSSKAAPDRPVSSMPAEAQAESNQIKPNQTKSNQIRLPASPIRQSLSRNLRGPHE